jgi:DNA-binding NarL/FixJ family response regulator
VSFQHAKLDQRFSPAIEITAFRIVQEALANVAIHTTVNQADVQIWVDGDHLRLQIEDQGQGFNIETMLNIEGVSTLTGLYERVGLLGGEFTIVSASESGTRVFAQIPLETDYRSAPQAKATSPTVPPRVAPDTITIVLADAHDLTRKGLRSLLEDEPGFTIVGEAATQPEILAVIENTHPGIIVLDAGLGWDTVLQIAQLVPDTHVLMLSTHTEEAYVHEALRKGVLGYVLKESSLDELVQAVRTVAAGRRYLSQMLSERAIDTYLSTQQSAPSDHDPLSNREREILELIVQGARTSSIANLLTISPRTVETHRANLMRKLGVRTQAELVRYALQHGIGI